MEQQIEQYLVAIRADYARFGQPSSVRDTMIAEFNSAVRLDVGNKFIKVVTSGSVHSFIVKEDGAKFKRGDILKAASWSAPAKNFARGNVLTSDFTNVRWTGA